jgi:hypothetical protein
LTRLTAKSSQRGLHTLHTLHTQAFEGTSKKNVRSRIYHTRGLFAGGSEVPRTPSKNVLNGIESLEANLLLVWNLLGIGCEDDWCEIEHPEVNGPGKPLSVL